MEYYIYSLTNTVNKKRYIGQTKDPKKRWSHHRCDLRRGAHHNKYLQHDWNDFGESAFIFVILEQCSEDLRNKREQFWIKKYDSMNKGYNMCKGGVGICDYKHTDDEILKMRIVQNPKAVLQLDKEFNIVNRWLSCAHAGKQLGLSIRGIKAVCNRINHQKTIGGFYWVYEEDYNSTHFDNTYFVTHEADKKLVLQLDLDLNIIKEWSSIYEASKGTGISTGEISCVCNGYKNLEKRQRYTAGGFVWRFKDGYNHEEELSKSTICYHNTKKHPFESRRKKVAQYSMDGELIKIHNSLMDAGEELGVSWKVLGRCASGHSKSSYGFMWKYVG